MGEVIIFCLIVNTDKFRINSDEIKNLSTFVRTFIKELILSYLLIDSDKFPLKISVELNWDKIEIYQD